MLVHENAVVKITKAMPLDIAALLGCGVATGLGAVFNTAGVKPGETVAVIGCGGVGLSAIQGARIADADTIIAIDRIDEKLQLAETLGATHVVNTTKDDAVDRVHAMTESFGVHHAFEAVGSTATAELAFALLRRGGTATIIGLIPAGQVRVPSDELFWEKKLQGSVMGSNRFRINTPHYVDMYLDGRLNLGDMVSDRLELSEINEGFARMQTGQVAREIVVFDPME
jgi:S-(hydroxymethyl)glutathione dehydrogenase/alcohol dehydrogenase